MVASVNLQLLALQPQEFIFIQVSNVIIIIYNNTNKRPLLSVHNTCMIQIIGENIYIINIKNKIILKILINK